MGALDSLTAKLIDVCFSTGCKTLPPNIVACEGTAIILTRSQEKGEGPVIRACSVIRSNTVVV